MISAEELLWFESTLLYKAYYQNSTSWQECKPVLRMDQARWTMTFVAVAGVDVGGDFSFADTWGLAVVHGPRIHVYPGSCLDVNTVRCIRSIAVRAIRWLLFGGFVPVSHLPIVEAETSSKSANSRRVIPVRLRKSLIWKANHFCGMVGTLPPRLSD